MYFSSEVSVITVEKNISKESLFFSFIKLPKKKQKLSVNKSPHVFKKSKERFVVSKPVTLVYVTPYFSNQMLLKIYLRSILKYFYSLSFSNQIKIKVINSFLYCSVSMV